jgi:hypothetical protein
MTEAEQGDHRPLHGAKHRERTDTAEEGELVLSGNASVPTSGSLTCEV